MEQQLLIFTMREQSVAELLVLKIKQVQLEH